MLTSTYKALLTSIVFIFIANALVAAERPNILFFFADDQRNHTLGCAGHPVVQTPNIDHLAEQGVRFENSFVPTPTCWTSRACLITGTYERKHRYRSDGNKALNTNLARNSYLATLKRAGYRVSYFGKDHHVLSKLNPEMMYDEFRPLFRNPYFKKQPDGSLRHTTQILGDWAVDFLNKQSDDQPFCLTVAFNAAHAEDRDKRPGIGHFPWPKVVDGMYEDQTMPEPPLHALSIYESQPDFLKNSLHTERYHWRWDTPGKYQTNMRAYFRMITGIDHVIGRVTKALEQQGLADNTVIIYSADNGYYMGDRRFAGKWTHYEQSLRVPMILFDPRAQSEQRGQVREEIVMNIDLAATMLDLAGEPIPSMHDGRSMVPLMRNEDVDWRKEMLCEFIAVPRTIPKWEGVRGERYTYARYFVEGLKSAPMEFLYDLKTDPNQLTNLAEMDDQKLLLKQLSSRCDQLIAQTGEPMPAILGK